MPAILVLATLIGACGLDGSGPSPSPVTFEVGSAYDVWLNNTTPIPLVLLVNGNRVAEVNFEQVRIPAGSLGALPWHVAVKSANGRDVLSFIVEQGSVGGGPTGNGGYSVHGVAERVDLECGRIDAWVGPPMGGPIPPPNAPPCEPFLR